MARPAPRCANGRARHRTAAPWFEPAIPPLLALGALAAIAAAGAGYLLGTSGGYGGDTYLRHQLAGFVVAATASLAALTAYVRGSAARGFRARFHATALVAALAALVVAGHLGATLTHGEG